MQIVVTIEWALKFRLTVGLEFCFFKRFPQTFFKIKNFWVAQSYSANVTPEKMRQQLILDVIWLPVVLMKTFAIITEIDSISTIPTKQCIEQKIYDLKYAMRSAMVDTKSNKH